MDRTYWMVRDQAECVVEIDRLTAQLDASQALLAEAEDKAFKREAKIMMYVNQLAERDEEVARQKRHKERTAMYLRKRMDKCQKAESQNAVLRGEVEQLRVQLAGCGVAAMCNTRESMQQQLCHKGDYGYSASYQDVIDAVKREIDLRDENAALRTEVERLNQVLHQTSQSNAELIWEVIQEARKQAAQGIIEDVIGDWNCDCGYGGLVIADAIKAKFGLEYKEAQGE